MFNFKISKQKEQKILENVLFTEDERIIFDKLIHGYKRKELPQELGLSLRTIARKVRSITKKINEYQEGEPNITHKVYMHKFPNGKKYVGVCQCCEDRWCNGFGYASNKKMFNDIKKYGWDSIKHDILFETTDSYIAYELEALLIKELDLINTGYNNV